jgi:hypothetical protein
VVVVVVVDVVLVVLVVLDVVVVGGRLGLGVGLVVTTLRTGLGVGFVRLVVTTTVERQATRAPGAGDWRRTITHVLFALPGPRVTK